MVAKKDLPANTLGELVTWMKANPGQDQLRQPERRRQRFRRAVREPDQAEGAVYPLSRRRAGDD
jgi:hypothetical protein